MDTIHNREMGGVKQIKKRLSDAVYAKTEPERHRLEVEYVAKQSNEWIKTHLEGVRVKRGELAYQRLRQDVLKLWKKHK